MVLAKHNEVTEDDQYVAAQNDVLVDAEIRKHDFVQQEHVIEGQKYRECTRHEEEASEPRVDAATIENSSAEETDTRGCGPEENALSVKGIRYRQVDSSPGLQDHPSIARPECSSTNAKT